MRGTVGLVGILLLLVAGCGDDGAGSGPWSDGVEPAAAAGRVGGDEVCPLPVTMDVADRWQAEAVDGGTLRQGGLDLVCEIDAKPAGAIGFIRVWTGTVAPRAALEAYVAEARDTGEVTYRDTEVGSGSGTEATWTEGDSGRKRA